MGKNSGKVVFVFFFQCRPEKPIRLLTLNKDMVWYGLMLSYPTINSH
jgi:hypothetical protein